MKTGLIGWPLEHSLSPQIHKIAFEMSGIVGNYSLFPIPPNSLTDQENILNLVRRKQIHGLNVTIPFKQSIIPLLDGLEGDAERYLAVNTIFLRNGMLIGTNTDGSGFKHDLKATIGHQEFDGRNAMLFGAGGSARAVLVELLKLGMFVTIVVRDRERANAYLSKLTNPSNENFIIIEAEQLSQHIIDGVSLIVNATPLGMYPTVDDMPISEKLIFNQDQCIYDLIYNPKSTKLINKAMIEGAKARNGFGMLVEQALLSFEIWTGICISRTEFYYRYHLENGGELL